MHDTYVRDNIKRFYQPIDMPGGYKWNHVATLKRMELYYRGRYESGQFDDQGLYKFFFNITKPVCDIATKFIDLDTKDLVFTPMNQGDDLYIWALQKEFRPWLTTSKFAQTLNRMAEEYPKGHVVLKKTREGWKVVNLLNLRTDTTAEWLRTSDFVYQPMRMSRGEILDMPWDQSTVAELLKRDAKTQHFLVYDCFHRDGKVWKRSVKADLFTKYKGGSYERGTEAIVNDNDAECLPALVLHEEEVKSLPYREMKWEEYPGRWLGFGFPEYLFDDQIATNETENLERKALIHKALQLWQSPDDNLAGSNVITSAQNGDIITATEPITPIQKDNADLSAYNNTRSRWEKNTQSKTFTPDLAKGENPPSRTPIGVANLTASMFSSYYDLKRENFGLFVKDLLMEDTIPEFKRNSRKERMLTFAATDEDASLYQKAVLEMRINQAVVEDAFKTGYYPSQFHREELRIRLQKELAKSRFHSVKIPADAYDNLPYKLDINITGEQADTQVKQSIYNMALQLYNANPGITANPVGRRLLFKLIALSGESPAELGMLADEAQQAPVQPMAPGGSVSQPSPVEPSATPGPAPLSV